MHPTAVPRAHDVVKVKSGSHHDDLCVVETVIDGCVTIHHGNNDTIILPLTEVVVICRPGWREHVE